MLEWLLFELFGENSYLYEPDPDVLLFYDPMENLNTYSNDIIYEMDVNSSCTLPFVVKREFQVFPFDSHSDRMNNSVSSHPRVTGDEWDQSPPDFFDNHKSLRYSKRCVSSQNRPFASMLMEASKPTAIIDLVNEVIENGFGSVLNNKQKRKHKRKRKKKRTNKKNTSKNNTASEHSFSNNQNFEYLKNASDLFTSHSQTLHFLRSKFSIIKQLENKLNDKRHVMMRSPLSNYPSLLLALMLYTNCDQLCSSVKQTLVDAEYNNHSNTKWKVLKQSIYTGLYLLSKFERLDNVSLYCGMHDVFLDTRGYGAGRRVQGYLNGPVSLSRDCGVAKGFSFGNGVVLGMKMDENYFMKDSFYAADVSWISKYNEKEILATNVPFDISPSQCVTDWNKQQQWISLTPYMSVDTIVSEYENSTNTRMSGTGTVSSSNSSNSRFDNKDESTGTTTGESVTTCTEKGTLPPYKLIVKGGHGEEKKDKNKDNSKKKHDKEGQGDRDFLLSPLESERNNAQNSPSLTPMSFGLNSTNLMISRHAQAHSAQGTVCMVLSTELEEKTSCSKISPTTATSTGDSGDDKKSVGSDETDESSDDYKNSESNESADSGAASDQFVHQVQGEDDHKDSSSSSSSSNSSGTSNSSISSVKAMVILDLYWVQIMVLIQIIL